VIGSAHLGLDHGEMHGLRPVRRGVIAGREERKMARSCGRPPGAAHVGYTVLLVGAVA